MSPAISDKGGGEGDLRGGARRGARRQVAGQGARTIGWAGATGVATRWANAGAEAHVPGLGGSGSIGERQCGHGPHVRVPWG